MRKKNYLKPDVRVHQVKPTAILAGSGNLQASPANENYGTTDETYKSGWN